MQFTTILGATMALFAGVAFGTMETTAYIEPKPTHSIDTVTVTARAVTVTAAPYAA